MRLELLPVVFVVAIMAKMNSGYTKENQLSKSDPYIKSLALRNKRSITPRNDIQHIIEIAVFCDKECGEYFNNDRNKTLNYLLAMLLDASMYYTSLQNYNVLFAVTSFTQFNSTADQPFVEEGRNNNGTIVVSSILRPFGTWIHSKLDGAMAYKFPAFDFAILFTGSAGSDRSNTYSSSLCLASYSNVFWGVSVFRLYVPSASLCTDLAQAIALGFGHSATASLNGSRDHYNCWDKEYVFETKTLNCRSPHKYFFSSCSQKVIGNYFSYSKVHCLQSGHYRHENTLEYTISYDTILTPPMSEQCKIATNRTDVYSKQGEENCLQTKCYEGNTGNETFVQDMYPMANTPCGDSKICFRGRCLLKGYRLQNSNNSNCIVSSNRFSYNDAPILSKCPELPTPLDRLMVLQKEKNTFYLATPYSTPDAEENADKCLTLDCKYNILMFDRCPENNSWFEWSFIENDSNEQTFLLFHSNTQKCIAINQSSSLLYGNECNFNQSSMHWNFIEKHPKDIYVMMPTPTGLLTSRALDLFVQNSNDHKSPSSSEKFGLGMLSGILLACVIAIALFVTRRYLNIIKSRSTRNECPTESAVYTQEQNIELLLNL